MIRRLPLCAAFALMIGGCVAPDGPDDPVHATCDEVHPDHTVGLRLCLPGADDGYTLIAPMGSTDTWLIDRLGRSAQTWHGSGTPGAAVQLLPNGHLLRTTALHPNPFGPSVSGGRLEEYSWDGDLVWSFDYANERVVAHHDVAVLPNGNYVLIAFEKIDGDEAIAAGRDPSTLSPNHDIYPEHLVEIDPSTDTVVWEWHLWDHVVQSFDPTKANFGDPEEHPELMELNTGPLLGDGDWAHVNSVAYHPGFDQLLLSSAFFSEVWVIDHSATSEEAAGHDGGARGRGGDFLYRWGSPGWYGQGSDEDLPVDAQHDAQWVAEGLPGAGNILLFDNGGTAGQSVVLEIEPPATADGDYLLPPGEAWGPAGPSWTYTDPAFFSPIVAGAQRLPNGDTLISEGTTGRLFEVTPDGEVVWEYISPVAGDTVLRQGDTVPIQFELPAGTVSANWVFRVERYAPDYPGLAELDTSAPTLPIEDDPAG